MAGRVRTQLRQTRPFRLLEEEAFVHIARTADALLQGVAETVKPAGLSPTQYHVLRILRGAGRDGLACRAIGKRMVNRDPDVTRLLDRLENRGLVVRTRDRGDRRVITTRITAAGLRVLVQLDGPMVEVHTRLLGHLGAVRLRSLIDLLELARSKAG